jgi:hypothetical protein
MLLEVEGFTIQSGRCHSGSATTRFTNSGAARLTDFILQEFFPRLGAVLTAKSSISFVNGQISLGSGDFTGL